MPDPSAPPQPQTPHKKHSRFWLFAPYVALLVVALAWSGFWMVEKWRVEHDLPKRVAEIQKQGYVAQWSSMKVGGYPFRLHVTLVGPKFADTAGWGLSATRIEARAWAYAPDSWVMAAPEGLVFSRPGKGDVAVSGKAIRASVAALGTAQPRLAFEGDKLTLAPAQGATAPGPGSACRPRRPGAAGPSPGRRRWRGSSCR